MHLLPTLWFRNTWSWTEGATRPSLQRIDGPEGVGVVQAEHETLGARTLYVEGNPPLLFTENETNQEQLFGQPNPTPYVKDGIDQAVVHGRADAVNPAQTGSKCAAHYTLGITPGETARVRLRLADTGPDALPEAYPGGDPFDAHFDEVVQTRQREADAFYEEITPGDLPADAASVMRQALAGMLWTKQFYSYDVAVWLREHGATHLAGLQRLPLRNKQWYHMVNDDIISMPDKWEYPWYAAWDLAFHTISLAMVDVDFAKEQLALILRENYLHPNGQLPAYEWNFGDVNPPVHAWGGTHDLRDRERGPWGRRHRFSQG